VKAITQTCPCGETLEVVVVPVRRLAGNLDRGMEISISHRYGPGALDWYLTHYPHGFRMHDEPENERVES